MGAPGKSRLLLAICLPIHTMLGSSCCTHPHSKRVSNRVRPGKGDGALSGNKPVGDIWGTCMVNSAWWHLAGLYPGSGWSCMGAARSTTGRPRSTPQHCLVSLHLRSGQVSSSARGRGHSTGARATVQGDRLTGQAWLPGLLPSLGVGGSRPGPTIGWCRGKGFSPEGQSQEPELMTQETPASPPKTQVLDPTSPRPPHTYTHLGPQRE